MPGQGVSLVGRALASHAQAPGLHGESAYTHTYAYFLDLFCTVSS
jgi:hypothetical protein